MFDTINIMDILNFVCYDCIDIIFDYIDIPYDILKIIYYNKYYLYNLNKNDNCVNRTVDNVQLLLYKKFYEKVMINLSNFCKNFEIKCEDVFKLLDNNTILAGGSVLQSIYGKIDESTEIPLDFYYNEYLDIYDEIDIHKLKYFIGKYETKRTTTVCTDMDIFKVTNIDIFNSNEIVECYIYPLTDLEVLEIYRTIHGSYIIVISMDSNDNRYDKCYSSNSKIAKIIKKKNFNVYIKIINKVDKNFREEQNDTAQFSISNYKVINVKNIRKHDFTRKKMLNLVQNHKDCVQLVSTIPEIITCYKSFNKYGGNEIEDYLLKNNDMLMKNILKNKYFVKNGKSESHLTYDNLEARDMCVDREWKKSPYDPYDFCDNDNVDEEDYNIVFNSGKMKNIVPIARPVGNGLMLNLVYINANVLSETKKYIDNFDINICKQSFDGKKLMLHSIGDLVNKRFRYNPNKITDIETENNIKKYICFKKRIEKYKARGFSFVNEIEITNEIKKMMKIDNMKANIGILEDYYENEYLKKYYEYIIKNFSV